MSESLKKLGSLLSDRKDETPPEENRRETDLH